MRFNGFSSISEYERVASTVGFSTRRENYGGPEPAFLMITHRINDSPLAVDTWHLFSADETRELIPNGGIFNGIDEKRIEAAGFTKII